MMQPIVLKSIPHPTGFAVLQERLENAKIDVNAPKLARLKSGGFLALVPEGTTDERAANFRSGLLLTPNPTFLHEGYTMSRTPDTRVEAGEFLSQKMASMKNPTLYVHDFDASVEALARWGANAVVIEGQTYAIYTDRLDDAAAIGGMLERSNSIWHSLAVVIDEEQSITSNEELISKAQLIIMSVYDGESYLIWDPQA